MGQIPSLPILRYGCCIRPQNPNICHENHAGRPKRGSRHKSNISATFTFPASTPFDRLSVPTAEDPADLININTATEEQLMTLSGINRQTAQNIVEYRQHIGGFRRVEDLALVSGVGATRLQQLYVEVCTAATIRRPPSRNYSSSSSGIDVSAAPDSASRSSSASGFVVVNVNTANVFQLMKIKSISQTLAENIVMYRDRKGPFLVVDDIGKVKGIKEDLLSKIRPFVVVSDETEMSWRCTRNGSVTLDHVGFSAAIDRTCTGNGSATLDYGETMMDRERLQVDETVADILSLYGPLLRKCSRRKHFDSCAVNCQDSVSTLRLATWNLDGCGIEKACNPGVKEVIAMTLLENR